MPDFSTFNGIRVAREELFEKLDPSFAIERRQLLKDAEESILAQDQLELYKKGQR